MREFYSATEKNMAPPVLLANRLYTVRVEEEEVLRAQVCEVMAEKVKVSQYKAEELQQQIHMGHLRLFLINSSS